MNVNAFAFTCKPLRCLLANARFIWGMQRFYGRTQRFSGECKTLARQQQSISIIFIPLPSHCFFHHHVPLRGSLGLPVSIATSFSQNSIVDWKKKQIPNNGWAIHYFIITLFYITVLYWLMDDITFYF